MLGAPPTSEVALACAGLLDRLGTARNIGVILRRGDNKFSGLVEDLVVSVVVFPRRASCGAFSQGYELAGNRAARLPHAQQTRTWPRAERPYLARLGRFSAPRGARLEQTDMRVWVRGVRGPRTPRTHTRMSVCSRRGKCGAENRPKRAK